MYSTLVCTEDMGDSKVLTFLVLDDYMADNQECRTSKWHYYQKLWWFTSSCFPHLVPVRLLAAVFIFHSLSFLGQDCYQEFLTAYWKWMNLKALKWHGFDCQLNPGKLTISCPPCPQPGINLPTGWESDPNQWETSTISARAAVDQVWKKCVYPNVCYGWELHSCTSEAELSQWWCLPVKWMGIHGRWDKLQKSPCHCQRLCWCKWVKMQRNGAAD